MIENKAIYKRSPLIFALLLILFLMLETSITTLPLIVGLFVLITVFFKNALVFFLAFFIGFLFDILTLRTVGVSSIFLVAVVFFILLYRNKFEIETSAFIFIASFLSCFFFLLFLGTSFVLIQALIVAVVTWLLFQFFKNPIRIGK
jgi:cell shape-determining protein MreD